MAKRGPNQSAPIFVVLRESPPGVWTVVDEVLARPGLPARKARRRAILDATEGRARDGEHYAAVPRSYWYVFQVWSDERPE